MNEYLTKRFEERLLDSPLLADVDPEDPETAAQLAALVEGLYVEADGLDLR